MGISEAARISNVVQIAATKIYNENVLRETGENLQHIIQDACEEYARDMSDYKSKLLNEKDEKIKRLQDLVESFKHTVLNIRSGMPVCLCMSHIIPGVRCPVCQLIYLAEEENKR